MSSGPKSDRLLMEKFHYLYPGQMAVFREPTIISTLLGSCVAVALFDPVLKIGGLNHYLLPEPMQCDQLSVRYGTIAISELVKELQRNGADVSRLQAKIYGGGNVINMNKANFSIGAKNIEIAERTLKSLRIPVIEKNVGGEIARTIKVNTSNFEVLHRLNDEKSA